MNALLPLSNTSLLKVSGVSSMVLSAGASAHKRESVRSIVLTERRRA